MQSVNGIDKKQLLDYISELVDKEKALLDDKQSCKICGEAEKFRNSRPVKKLFAFFEAKGYHIVGLTEKQQIPRDRSQLALLLTKNRKILYPFTYMLLHTANNSFAADNATPEALSCLLNVCKNFSNRKWIDYEYSKKEKLIRIRRLAGFKGEVKHFLSGIFGEYGTAKLIEQTLQEFAKEKNGFKYKIFHDIKLKKTDSGNQNDMQLDLAVQLPEGFCIFETKMGSVLAIDKWVDRTRLFASGKNHFITCCADETLNPKIFQPFLLFNLEQLKVQLTELLQQDYPGS